ncbi:MAG: DegT/DnrJ/EryC1/StrS aminotransferase family protein [bacterium]|nr:DegT/DnrJ/EryC1/StrS aminotransferase family protein [bacterium]
MKSAFLHEHETKEALAKFILQARRLSMDQQCARFEREFAAFQGTQEAVLFNSGSSANLAMIQTLKNLDKLNSGDNVGFSALTWSTNLMPLIQLDLQPVPLDCEPATLNVMSTQLEHLLEHTELQALFITNALGFAGDLGKIRQICHERQIILLEDNCEALGTELPTGKTGTFGDMASCSFFVAHHMSTIEGGMVCTSNEEYAEMLRLVRANGWDRNLSAVQQRKWRKLHHVNAELDAKYTFYDLAYNFRPTEITGFLGCYQLQFLEENIAVRERNHLRLEQFVQANPDLIVLDHAHLSVLSGFAFPVLCKTPELRDVYLSQFSGAGVEIRPIIAGNIQKQPFYRKYITEVRELPGADEVHHCGFYCGNYPELTESDLETLSSCLSKY